MRTIWIQTDAALNGGQYLVDTDTRKPPVITEADALRVELGSFASGLPKDLGDFTSLNLSIFESRFAIDGTPLVSESVQAADVTDLISLSAWNNRLASNATWEITAPSLTFELGSDTSRKLFMAIYGITSSSETLLGSAEITVLANQDPNRAGIGFQSAWTLDTSYGKKDLARNDGTVYISKLRHTSDADSEPGTGEDWEDFWDVFVERGATGPTGADGSGDNGWTPVFATVSDSARRVLQVSDWTGGEGTKPATGKYVGPTGFVDAVGDGVDIRGPQGATGPQGNTGSTGSTGSPGSTGATGADGNDGWTPVFAIVSDSARRVLQVSDWTGGEGTKPATGKYVGVSGFVDAVGDAIDIRGPQGATGETGATGPAVPMHEYGDLPSASPAGQFIIVNNANSDTGNALQTRVKVGAISDGTYFRYTTDDSIVGGV